MTGEELVRRGYELGALVPVPLQHKGYVLADLGVDYTEGGERWTVRMYTPLGYSARVDTDTYEHLVEIVNIWVRGLGKG